MTDWRPTTWDKPRRLHRAAAQCFSPLSSPCSVNGNPRLAVDGSRQSVSSRRRRCGRTRRSAWLLLSSFFLLAIPAWATPPTNAEPYDDLARRLRSIAGEGHQLLDTGHFIIWFDTPRELVTPLVGRLEGTYNAILAFCEMSSIPVEPLERRMGVVLFDDQAEFSRYRVQAGVASSSIAGFYSPQTNLSVFGNTLNRDDFRQVTTLIEDSVSELRALGGSSARGGRQQALEVQIASLRAQRDALVERFNRFVIQHEAAHQLFFNLGVHVPGADNPAWLVEGLACQFEIPQGRRDGILGRINHVRLADLRESLGMKNAERRLGADRLRAALAGGRLLPLRRLVSESDVFSAGPSELVYRYAQAWSLVFYLHRAHRDSFVRYLLRLRDLPPGQPYTPERRLAEFSELIGDPDEAFERLWADYMARVRFDPKEAG